MTTINPSFDEFRVKAAREFAQTMIVIDDEARQTSDPSYSHPVGTLRRPTRQSSSSRSSGRFSTQSEALPASGKYLLDAKALVEKSMELGLICSVLKPKEGEEFEDKVVNAASIADIVCLDWEIYNDEGDAASRIIQGIIDEDNERNGRLRLIAIYTGDSTNNKILEKIFNAIPQEIRRNQKFRKHQLHIQSETGVRIVCLFKSHGIQLKDSRSENQISEETLPERLLQEFSRLSDGLLSGVALATAGSMRRSTHHVLSQFSEAMDGPYFHHRAMLDNPEDAEGYAVDVILSQLESFVDRERIAKEYAGHQAIESRIREYSEKLTLHYRNANKPPSTYGIERNVSIRMVQEGIESVYKAQKLPNPPGGKAFKRYFATLFFLNLDDFRSHMHCFAGITSVRAHPDHYLFKLGHRAPKLGLGTIVQTQKQEYLLCLQAACDSVRIDDEASFLFVPLYRADEADDPPEHVVPISEKGESKGFIGLQTSSGAYRIARSICFRGSNSTRTVNAEGSEGCSDFYFKDIEDQTYLWVADLKHRRALRTVQKLAQDMGRLGFDEFEPYRK